MSGDATTGATPPQRVLIAGCGDVGCALGVRLAAEGHHVWGLRRQPVRLPAAITGIEADLCRPLAPGLLPQRLDFVLYMPGAGRRDRSVYRALYVDGLERLLNALSAQLGTLQRLIYVSSTAVYGQRSGEWVDERSATAPRGFNGELLLAGESIAAQAQCASLAVRFAGIYGPGRRRLVTRVLAGAPCVADPPRYTNRVHRDDCAGMLRHLMWLVDPQPVYIGADAEPAPECVVLDWLARQLGVSPPRRVPAERVIDQNKRCSSARLVESGYRLRYPTFRDGYAPLLDTPQRTSGNDTSDEGKGPEQ